MKQEDSKSPPAGPEAGVAREPRVTTPDTAALKALAHPDRLRMLGLLRFDGPATATSLAKRMGLNSGATSYHLRQLAQHGFIEEAEGQGNKRERWWQARHEVTQSNPAEMEGDALEAGMAMIRAILSQHAALMQRAIAEFPALPVEWRRASNTSDYVMALTAEEAFALKEKLTALLWEELRKAPAQESDADPRKRNFMIMLHAFPFSGAIGQEGKDADPEGNKKPA